MPKAPGHDLPHRAQGSPRGVSDAGAGGGRQLERHRQGDGLFVVEQHRRKVGAGVEAVAAVRAHRGANRVSELPQAVHVATDRAFADAQSFGQ